METSNPTAPVQSKSPSNETVTVSNPWIGYSSSSSSVVSCILMCLGIMYMGGGLEKLTGGKSALGSSRGMNNWMILLVGGVVVYFLMKKNSCI